MERFPKIVNSSKPSTTFSKHPILDIWQWSEHVSEQDVFCSDPVNKLFLNIDILFSMEQMLPRPCFLEVSQIWTILRLFLINTLLVKSICHLWRLITLCSEKLGRGKYPQKLMSGNSKAETFKNQ